MAELPKAKEGNLNSGTGIREGTKQRCTQIDHNKKAIIELAKVKERILNTAIKRIC